MKRSLIIASIIIGLPVGFFARAAWEIPPNRAVTAISLFKTHCVSLAKGQAITPSPKLTKLELVPGEIVWADPTSKFILTFSSNSCNISDELFPMTDSEHGEFKALVIDMVQREFPILQRDHNHGLDTWDTYLLWAQYPLRDPRRWGIYLGRWSAYEGGNQNNLNIYFTQPKL